MTGKRLAFLLPLAAFLALAAYLALGLGRDPQELPSVLLNREVPEFALPPIEGRARGLSKADLGGRVALVNVFGSWCVACRIEHPLLMEIAEKGLVPIHGIDWREKNRADGPAWLARYGDPYTLIGDDPQSRGAIAFGVTGAPETFVVDARGVIRYKQTGPITREVWESTLWPLIRELRKP